MEPRKQIVDLAIQESRLSDYEYKIGAVIWRKKSVISSGHNYPLRSARHLHPKFQKWPGSIHAEADAILRAKTDLTDCNLLVVRTNNHGDFRNSKPCKWCMAFIIHSGIKNIFYSIEEYPFIERIKL